MKNYENIEVLTLKASSLHNFNCARKKLEVETGLKISNSQVVDALTENFSPVDTKRIILEAVGDDSIDLVGPLKSMIASLIKHQGPIELKVDELTLKSRLFEILEDRLGFKERLVIKIHFNLIPELSNIPNERAYQMLGINNPEFLLRVSLKKFGLDYLSEKLQDLVILSNSH